MSTPLTRTSPQEHPTQLPAVEVVLLPLEHVASLSGVRTVDLRETGPRAPLVPLAVMSLTAGDEGDKVRVVDDDVALGQANIRR